MKNIKIEKKIELPEIKKVKISNELMGTVINQSEDNSVHLTAELYVRMSGETGEVKADDFIRIKSDEGKGTVAIDIDELDLEEDDYDLSHRSTITISVPAEAAIIAETDNFLIEGIGLNNNLQFNNENGPIKLEDCNGNVKIHNENGPVKMYKCTGELVIEQENGPISTDYLSGPKLEISSENGPVKMRENQFNDVDIRNENGVVYYESLPIEIGSIRIENENGHINLALAPNQGFSLEATSELGHIKNSFMGTNHFARGNYTYEVGDANLKISLSTENGMMKITSSDMVSADYLKGKLEQIGDILKDNSEQGIEEAHKMIGQLMASLSRVLEKVNEDAIRDKMEQALAQLKNWKSKINDPETRQAVNESLESVSQEINHAVQEAIVAAKEAVKAAKEKYHEEYHPHFEKHFGKDSEFMKQFRHFRNFKVPPMPPFPPSESQQRKEAMQEAARLKILEMLEAGKITSDEAEKLLKAIH